MENVENEMAENVDNEIDRQPISTLLQGARCMFRVYYISEKVRKNKFIVQFICLG